MLTDSIRAVVAEHGPPVRVMELAAELAGLSAHAPLTLLRMSAELESPQLAALGVFHAAASPPSWIAPVVLHRALSSGHPPQVPAAVANTFSLLCRVATEFDFSFRFLAGWTGWFILDHIESPDASDEATDALQLIADVGVGYSFVTEPVLRKLATKLRELSLSRAQFLAGQALPDGLDWLKREFEDVAHTFAPEDKSFVESMLLSAEHDRASLTARNTAPTQMLEARIAWRTSEKVLQAAQHLLGLVEALTRHQTIERYSFATGSFIVELETKGLMRALPALDGGQARQLDPPVYNRLNPVLSLVSTRQYDVSIRTVPSDGARPTTWAPTSQQAAALLALPIEESTNQMTHRMVLRGTDPDSGGGYARLQFQGTKETIKATLVNRDAAKGWIVGNAYDADLIRHDRHDGTSWSLIQLHTPASDSATRHLEIFNPTEIPRVSNLARLHDFLRVVRARGSARDMDPREFGVQMDTTIAYWTHFAQTIEALDGHGNLTREGELAELGGVPVLCRLFSRSKLARALLSFSRRDKLAQVLPDEIKAFVAASVPGVHGSTLKQRTDALTNLVRECAPSE